MAHGGRGPRLFDLAIGISTLLVAQAAAGAFIGVTDARLVTLGCSGDNGPGTCSFGQSVSPNPAFADFDHTIDHPPTIWQHSITSSQDSSFGPVLLAGTGSVSVGNSNPGDWITVESLYDITFDVDVATPYQLTGALTARSDSGTRTQLTLSGDVEIFSARTPGESGEHLVDFDHAGVLDPGRYRLQVRAWTGGLFLQDGQLASFQFQLVPEPTSALLLGLGLALLTRGRSSG